MRKITHINLGSFLLESEEVHAKRKCFLFGNILPDCLPTFIYVKHNIDNTLDKVEKLLFDLSRLSTETYLFWIKLGCLMHYIADYFTFPHTRLFHEGFWKHNSYEKELKDKFKEDLQKMKEFHNNLKNVNITTVIQYIKEQQLLYFSEKEKRLSDVEIDIQYIFRVCDTIFTSICQNKQVSFA